MSYKILDVELTKSTLAVKEQFIIRVSIGNVGFCWEKLQLEKPLRFKEVG